MLAQSASSCFSPYTIFPMTSAISIKNVSKSFGSKKNRIKVLHDISISVEPGEVFGFIGPNGAGKTSTIKLLLNFTRPDSGIIYIAGKKVGCDEFRQHIGYLPEFPCFFEHTTARETLILSGRLSGKPMQLIMERIPRLLTRLSLKDAADKKIRGFSKGMKQRLGMANALLHDPEVLIFDEPMSGLDPLGRHLIKGIFAELRTQGKTIFFSSHILSDIEDLCDQIGIIHKGRLLYTGDVASFTQGTDKMEERFITAIQEADRAMA